MRLYERESRMHVCMFVCKVERERKVIGLGHKLNPNSLPPHYTTYEM
jgi:hypothetical protein